MKEILLGTTGTGAEPVTIDVAKLLLTRLLITANSGGGKSWLIRRIAELICKILPVIIIDPEGEYGTLREKFPFVLIGPGGEAPADCRSAKLTMHKMLELRTSAIFDLSELEPHEKHIYVKIISEAAINSPKEFWRDTLFIFDEAQLFCPENGKGHSEARAAVLGFPTRGRKRGFGCIFATQRLAKLAFDARAEMLNRIIGMMFEPEDVKAAAAILGVKADQEFSRNMRTMPVGNFYGFGRAICLEPQLFQAGPVETSHEARKTKHGVKAPPTPTELRRLLPQLADLPEQAETEITNMREAEERIRELNQRLREARQVAARQTEPAKTRIVTEKILTPAQAKRLTQLQKQLSGLTAELSKLPGMWDKISIQLAEIKDGTADLTKALTPEREPMPAAAPVVDRTGYEPPQEASGIQLQPVAPKPTHHDGSGLKLSGALLDTLRVCAQYRATGASDSQIGILVGRKATSRKTFRSALKSEGLIEDYGAGWRATDKGIAALGRDFQPIADGQGAARVLAAEIDRIGACLLQPVCGALSKSRHQRGTRACHRAKGNVSQNFQVQLASPEIDRRGPGKLKPFLRHERQHSFLRH